VGEKVRGKGKRGNGSKAREDETSAYLTAWKPSRPPRPGVPTAAEPPAPASKTASADSPKARESKTAPGNRRKSKAGNRRKSKAGNRRKSKANKPPELTYTTRDELQAAVDEFCHAEVARRAGLVDPALDLTKLEPAVRARNWTRMTLFGIDFASKLAELQDDSAARLWRELVTVIARAHDYMKTRPSRPDAHEEKLHYMHERQLRDFLRVLDAGHKQLMPSKGLDDYQMWAEVEDERLKWEGFDLRTLIVLGYDDPEKGWWKGKAPRARDLALLSLLAGNFPDDAEDEARTVRDVIDEEKHRIRTIRSQNRKRLAAVRERNGKRAARWAEKMGRKG
jgi:hypothetical protein